MTNSANLPDDDELGFAYDAAGVEARQLIASDLLGHTIRRVRYVLVENNEEKFGPHGGLRAVSDTAELLNPDWRYPGVHSLDYGLEIRLDSGVDYFATWDSPGLIEGLRFARGDLGAWTGTAWDVTDEEPWSRLKDTPISRCDLNYEPWSPEGGFWCTTITIAADPATITIELAGVDANGIPELSADSLTVVYTLGE